jgi:hypothetical protein
MMKAVLVILWDKVEIGMAIPTVACMAVMGSSIF